MAGLSLCLLLGAGLLTWVLTSGSGGEETYVVPPPTSTPTTSIRPDEAGRAVQALQRALERDDRAAAASLAAPDDLATADLLAALADNVAAIGVTDLSLRYVEETGPVAGDGTWAAAVSVVWRYAGFDTASSRTEVELRFRVSGDRVVVAGVGGGDLRTPVWMSAPVQVRRTPTTLLVVAGDGSVEPYERLTLAAVPVSQQVLTTWRPRLVVEVPADEAALEAALGVDPGYYAQIAAVTGSADGSTAPGSPVHVYVNRAVFDGLGPEGQSVVMDHETAHVASDGPRSRAPTWLIEGLADYVALRDTTLPLTKTAAQIAADVRRHGPPDALPDPSDFDTQSTHLGAVYESAWLVCVTLADRGGERALTRFYTEVSAGTTVDAALRRDFDWSVADLVTAWRSRLEGLPR